MNSFMFIIIFSGVWGIVGIVFFLIGILMLNNLKKKEIHCTSKTYGKIVDIVRHQSSDNDVGYSVSWHPVIEYNVGELKFIKESIYGSSQSKYAIGQNVEVYFNPDDYNEYYIADDNLPKLLAKIFTAVGTGITILAIVLATVVLL